jgi:hypothetical protein
VKKLLIDMQCLLHTDDDATQDSAETTSRCQGTQVRSLLLPSSGTGSVSPITSADTTTQEFSESCARREW